MLFVVEALRHRTGRERIVFGDQYSRRAGRDFLRRLSKAGGSFRECGAAGISFTDLWSFDGFRLEDPRAAGFATWQEKNDAIERLAEQCRQTTADIREVLGLKVGPLTPKLAHRDPSTGCQVDRVEVLDEPTGRGGGLSVQGFRASLAG